MFLFFNYWFNMTLKFTLFLDWNKKAAKNFVFVNKKRGTIKLYNIISLQNNIDRFTYFLFCVNSCLIVFGKVWFLSLIHLCLVRVGWILGWIFLAVCSCLFVLFSVIFKNNIFILLFSNHLFSRKLGFE